MPLFRCSSCGWVENTASSNYWTNVHFEGNPPVCSACDQAIGQCHGQFPQRSAIGMLVDQNGTLWTQEQVDACDLPSCYTITSRIEWPQQISPK